MQWTITDEDITENHHRFEMTALETQPRIRLWLSVIGGRLECVGVAIGDSANQEPLTAKGIRIPFATLVDEARQALITQQSVLARTQSFPLLRYLPDDWTPSETEVDGVRQQVEERLQADKEARQKARKGPGRPRRDDSEIRKVAELRKHFDAQGSRRPNKEIGSLLNMAADTVAKYVADARRKGYLDPVERKDSK